MYAPPDRLAEEVSTPASTVRPPNAFVAAACPLLADVVKIDAASCAEIAASAPNPFSACRREVACELITTYAKAHKRANTSAAKPI
jgi:hypothetical protein